MPERGAHQVGIEALQKHARRNAGFNGTSLHTLAQMVANGLGVTLMPQMAIDAGILRGLDVTVRPLVGAAPRRRIGLVWRRSSARTETFRALGGALKAELEPDARMERSGRME